MAQDLAALGALGDEATANAAQRLATAMHGPITARLLEALGQVATELGETLPDHRVAVRLVGGEVDIVAEAERAAPPPEPEPGTEADARITLRLSSDLKARIEAASAREGVSVNTYVVRALSQSASSGYQVQKSRRRLTGYGRS